MGTLDDIAAASQKLRDLDRRRKDQQAYRDDLIRRALGEGIGWAEIKRASGLLNRSLQLAIKRTDPDTTKPPAI